MALALLATAGAAEAQALRDKWCSDVQLRFFVGGAEGDAFGTIVYNGAKQAAADTGAQVDYVFSGWNSEKMVQQLREAVAAAPDGIAMMGHPGDAAIMPLAEEASKAGIKMMYQNVPVDEVVAKFGGGYVGAQQEPQGRALGEEAVRRFGLQGRRHRDRHRRRSTTRTAARASAAPSRRSKEAGLKVVQAQHAADGEWAADPNLAHPGHHRGDPRPIPTSRLIAYPGGQLLGNVPTYMQAAGKKPGDIFNFGFDTSPQIVEAFKDGWVQLTADQQPFLQGYLPILSLCQQVVYGLAPINVDTGAGFVTPENYETVATLATEGAALDVRRSAGRASPAGVPAGEASHGRTADRAPRHQEVLRQRLCARRRRPARRPRRGRRPDRRQRRRQVDAHQDPRRRGQADQRRDPRARQAGHRLERGALARGRHRDGVPGPRARGAAVDRAQHLHGPRARRPLRLPQRRARRSRRPSG